MVFHEVLQQRCSVHVSSPQCPLVRDEAEAEHALGVRVLRAKLSEAVDHSKRLFNALPSILKSTKYT